MASKRANSTTRSSSPRKPVGATAAGKILKPHTARSTAAKRGATAATAARPAAKAVRRPAAAARKVATPVPRATASATRARRSTAAAARAPRTLNQVVLAALTELKALDVRALDVRGISDVTDTMVVASGTSDRHVRSIADRVLERCKEAGFRALGVEGQRDGEWVLLDLADLIVHVMLPRTREFYALEKLWEGAGVAA